MKHLIEKLKEQIANSIEYGNDLDAASWGMQEGVGIEIEKVSRGRLNQFKKFITNTLKTVMGQDSQLQVFTAELASEQIAKEAIEKLKQEYSGLVTAVMRMCRLV